MSTDFDLMLCDPYVMVLLLGLFNWMYNSLLVLWAVSTKESFPVREDGKLWFKLSWANKNFCKLT